MDFTVTIVTRNRAESLKEGLRSLNQQAYPSELFEVIVVDNGSTDHTREVAEEMAGDFSHFQYLYDLRPGQLVGWHRALQAANGSIACFTSGNLIC